MIVSFLKMKFFQVITKPGFYVLVLALLCYPLERDAVLWCGVLYGFILLNRWNNREDVKNEVALFDPAIPDILDSVISQCFAEYTVSYLAVRDKKYIGAKEEEQIIRDVSDIALVMLGKPMHLKLRAFYQEDSVDSVIARKIQMVVMSYTIQENMLKDDAKRIDVFKANKITDDII